MSIPPSMLGSYPVERELGRGGMGVVYLARDPRLDRHVAIKVLPDFLTLNVESLARFEREAKLLASLNHPNIAAIYGIEEANHQQLLVLEYVPGDTLAVRLTRGALPLDEALDVCRQIALAIEAADEGSVVHRDLKPGNVKITPDGQVKVLDFGLAKGGSASASGADLAHSPTFTYPHTAVGMILGTAGYMSPEQARGKVVDKRTDIWSFGCVLFECLTGRQIFQGDTVSDSIARILEREPDWSALPPQTPPKIRELLRRCLEKDLKKRQRDIGDVRIELDEAVAARSSSSQSAVSIALPPSRAWLSPRLVGLAALCMAVGAAAGIALWSTVGPGGRSASGTASGPVRLSVAIPPSINASYVGFSRDGQSLIALGSPQKPDGTYDFRKRLYVRGLHDYAFRPIPGTDGTIEYVRSPDGVWLAFVASISEQSSQRRLSKVRVDGSAPPVVLTDWDEGWGQSIAWLEDGDLLILSDGATKYFRLPSSGGPPKPAIKIDMGAFAGFPKFGNRLPHDRGVFLSVDAWGARGFQHDEWLLDPKTAKAQRLFENAGHATWAPTGHIVFTRGDALMAVPFDLDRLAATGEVTALENGVRTPNSWDNGTFEITDDGRLIYPPGGRLGSDRQLVTVDAAGTVKPFTAERRPYETNVSVTRDGRKVAVVLPNSKGTYETWVADLDRPGLKRVLALPNADCASPVWSPDGRRLAYLRTARDKDDGIYVQAADGSGSPQLVVKQDSQDVFFNPLSWASDGSGLIVTKFVGGKGDLLFAPLTAGVNPGPPRNARVTTANEALARVSPDGRLVAFTSDESGRNEVYVSTLGADGVFGPPVMVSSTGGSNAAWAGDGRRLFYYDEPDKLMSATIETKSGLSASTPVVVQDLKKLRVDSDEWDILPDGRLVAIQKGEGEDDITVFNVVLNWHEELRARMEGGRLKK